MFYSNFYTPFNYAFYPYFMPSFGRPTGYVLNSSGEVDSWWGNYPLGYPAKAPKFLGGGRRLFQDLQYHSVSGVIIELITRVTAVKGKKDTYKIKAVFKATERDDI
ncbi:hypothetical protein ACBZ92_12505 [Priestia aryabhattai]|uniref:hypothetical protein n=1 Tax=Priestia aryabhattai TaxID=412384 RepID=UPI0035615C18